MFNDKQKRLFKYYRQYQWSDIFTMVKNSRLDPKILTDDFTGKQAVITGATSGIGYHTAKLYASHGVDLFLITRNIQKSKALKTEIENDYGVKCNFFIADLSKLEDIFKAAEELKKLDSPIDILIHNAGVYLTKQKLTTDGLDTILVVHYLSSFIINYLLKDKLKSQEKARILLVSSEGHRFAAWGLNINDLNWNKRKYTGLRSYGSAKTAQLLSMLVFDEFFQNSGVTINAMHPGAVKTETGQENGPLYRWFKEKFFDKTLKSPELSAEALYYLGVSKEIEGLSGKFFSMTKEEKPAPPALDKDFAHLLWNKTIELAGLK